MGGAESAGAKRRELAVTRPADDGLNVRRLAWALLVLPSLLSVSGCAGRVGSDRAAAAGLAAPLSNKAVARVDIDNLEAGRFHRVGVLRDDWRAVLGRELDGSGVIVGIYEAEGGAVATHQVFGNRLDQKDKPVKFTAHATHVAGTVGASPPPAEMAAQGMAPAVSMHGYNVWTDEEGDLRQADPLMAASVHSYNWPAGWPREPAPKSDCAGASGRPPRNDRRPCWVWLGDSGAQEDWRFGKYGEMSATFDEVAHSRPTHTYVVSAANERDDAPGGANWDGWYVSNGAWTNQTRPGDGEGAGYDTITGDHATSKNVITIGSIDDAPTLDAQNIEVSAFSGFGPTDDGRIKPDLVANGNRLYSAIYARLPNGKPDLKAYGWDQGTSMSTPVVAGIVALLNDLSGERRGSGLFSDEAKAVLIHTAVNPVSGPSYSTGWGAVDAAAAGRIVGAMADSPRLIRAQTVAPHYELAFRARRGDEIKVTLVWLDRPGKVIPGLDAPDRSLVDDLDLLVIGPDGTRYSPWSLNSAEDHQGDAPTRCFQPVSSNVECTRNDRDNVEQVQVDGEMVEDGEWVVRVTAPAQSLQRPFALVVGACARRPSGDGVTCASSQQAFAR